MLFKRCFIFAPLADLLVNISTKKGIEIRRENFLITYRAEKSEKENNFSPHLEIIYYHLFSIDREKSEKEERKISITCSFCSSQCAICQTNKDDKEIYISLFFQQHFVNSLKMWLGIGLSVRS
jgi:hypothetical protein